MQNLFRDVRICALLLSLAAPALPASIGFVQHNLVSDIPGMASHTDANLVNPWGIASSGTSPLWVSDNGTGLSTLYNGSGQPLSLVVTIPPPGGGTPPAAPTGVVFNSGSGFGGDRFIFATEDGTVAGWQSGTSAVLRADSSGSDAIYKGLALGNNGSGDLLYAADFHNGRIDVFDSSYAPTTLSGSFTDPNLPSGFAPFNIFNGMGDLFVTYAKQDAAGEDDVPGPGNGIVDVFDMNGNLLRTLIAMDPGNSLNSPWGMAFAPAGFGDFGGDLLIGNFGDGRIHAFNSTTGQFEGELTDAQGNPIVIPGLWGLRFGNGGAGGDPGSLYFAAGIPGPSGAVEDHGLFGSITPVPEPGTALLILPALIGLAALRRR